MKGRAARPAGGGTGHGRLGLLSDERVKNWYDEIAPAGDNRLAAVTNVRKLGFLLERLGLSVDEVERLARKDPKALTERLKVYATGARAEGRLTTYLRKLFSSLRSYLAFRGIDFDGYPKLKAVEGVSIRTEKVPSQEQLGEVLERLSNRGRVIALLMAHSGVRPQVIGAYEGARGLVLSDLPDLDLETLRFARVPFTILGRAELSKTSKCWTTFGSRSLATAMETYLQGRRARGEKLGPSSPVVTANEVRGIAAKSKEDARSKLGFLTTAHVVLEVANVLHATAPKGTRLRPYVLRAYFSTGMLRASVDPLLREAMMNHDTGVPGAYTVGKPWSDDLIEKARSEYERACGFLESVARPKVDTRAELLTTLASAIEAATGKRTNGALQGEDLVKALRDALHGASDGAETATEASLPSPTVPAPVPAPKRTGEQRSVDAEAVGTYLESGWSFVSPLNSHLAVVRWDGAVP